LEVLELAVTAKQLAEYLNISPATVSMALQNSPSISEVTKQKVFQAAEKLGYDKHLKHNTTSNFISFIIYSKYDSISSNLPFFSLLIQAIENEARNNKYNLSITYFYEKKDIAEQLALIETTKCAGIILLATEMEQEDIKLFEKLNVPIVLLDNTFENSPYDSICINNRQGTKSAIDYLISCGHRNIGYLGYNLGYNNFKERLGEFRKQAERYFPKNNIIVNTFEVAPDYDFSAFSIDKSFLESIAHMTALFADNDMLALSVMRALKGFGYSIPKDISIIGFDDIPMNGLADPPLSSIAVPAMQMGKLSVERIMKHIQDPGNTPIKIEVSTKLVIRDSVKNLE
jgi:LacI family transcriptional regulator